MGLDFLAIGAHADDVEIGCGGTVAKLIDQGHRGAILDLTDATMATRGTPQLRREEAIVAANILGVSFRLNLGFPDASLCPHDEVVIRALVDVFREHRPGILLVHPEHDRHPDHEATCSLVREAAFKSGLAKYPANGLPWRPKRIFHYQSARSAEPQFCVDISSTWTRRVQALNAFASQFQAKEGEPVTAISAPSFSEMLEARARRLGSRIRVRYAEGFTCEDLPEVVDLCALSQEEF